MQSSTGLEKSGPKRKRLSDLFGLSDTRTTILVDPLVNSSQKDYESSYLNLDSNLQKIKKKLRPRAFGSDSDSDEEIGIAPR